MKPTSPTIEVRQIVFETLADMDVTDPGPCEEAVVVRDGYCLGRRFQFDEIRAVWREAEGEIEFFDAEGKSLRKVMPGWQEPLRRAA